MFEGLPRFRLTFRWRVVWPFVGHRCRLKIDLTAYTPSCSVVSRHAEIGGRHVTRVHPARLTPDRLLGRSLSFRTLAPISHLTLIAVLTLSLTLVVTPHSGLQSLRSLLSRLYRPYPHHLSCDRNDKGYVMGSQTDYSVGT